MTVATCSVLLVTQVRYRRLLKRTAVGMLRQMSRLNSKLVDGWRSAAHDLGIRVTAPVELWDAHGAKFECEALVHDFGSLKGGVVVSRKTERRVRESLRSLDSSVWVCIASDRQLSSYSRKHYIEELLDWGWFGEPERRPHWVPDEA